MMKRFFSFTMVLFSVACLAVGCGEMERPLDSSGLPDSPEDSDRIVLTAGVTESVPLMAGQTEEIGAVTLWIEDEILYVQYFVEGGWTLCET
ncbi:MAG: hypothetical protein KAV42_02345, partial [Candidatus Krumholzibacteria bacterium]|nr:hypothetical protein [Candidatus Krumholzibacteria bacterium]